MKHRTAWRRRQKQRRCTRNPEPSFGPLGRRSHRPQAQVACPRRSKRKSRVKLVAMLAGKTPLSPVRSYSLCSGGSIPPRLIQMTSKQLYPSKALKLTRVTNLPIRMNRAVADDFREEAGHSQLPWRRPLQHERQGGDGMDHLPLLRFRSLTTTFASFSIISSTPAD